MCQLVVLAGSVISSVSVLLSASVSVLLSASVSVLLSVLLSDGRGTLNPYFQTLEYSQNKR